MNVGLSINSIGGYIDTGYVTPLRGLVNITSYVDSITGITGTRTVQKQYSYTLDGITYTDYVTFSTTTDIAKVVGTIPIDSDFIIKFRYTRTGTDTTGVVTINSLNVTGTYSLAYLQDLKFPNTVFSPINFTDSYWNSVWLNLLEKLYEPGIVANYVERNFDDQGFDDADYITLFKTLAYYFSLPIALAEYYILNIFQNQQLLNEYLVEKGIFVEPSQILANLQKLCEEMKDQVRQRGTFGIFKQNGTFNAPIANPINGELLRLINFDQTQDEFIYEYLGRSMAGWWCDETFGDFLGNTNHRQLNKTPENTDGFHNLSLYTIINPSFVSLAIDGSKHVIQVTQGVSGFQTPPIIVNPSIGYQISFEANEVSSSPEGTINFEIDCYDNVGNLLNTINANTGANQNFFFQNETFLQTRMYYFVRGIIYAAGTSPLGANGNMEIGFGQNLIFPSNAFSIVIRLLNSNTTPNSTINFWNLKMKPAINPLGNGFIDSLNIINVWLKNKNVNLTQLQVESDIRRFLVPYGSIMNINYLN